MRDCRCRLVRRPAERIRRQRHAGPRGRAGRCRRRGRARRDRRAHSAGAGGRRGDRIGARCGAQHQPLRRSLVGAGRGQRRAFAGRATRQLPRRASPAGRRTRGAGVGLRLRRAPGPLSRRSRNRRLDGSAGRDRPADDRWRRIGRGFQRRSGDGAPCDRRRRRGEGPRRRPRLRCRRRRDLARRPRRRHCRAPGRHRGHRARRRRRAAGRRPRPRRRASLRSAAGHRMDARRRLAAPAAESPDHDPRGSSRPGCRACDLGQRQHRRELRRPHHATDLLVRPPLLRAGVSRILPAGRRARAHTSRNTPTCSRACSASSGVASTTTS